MNNVTKVFGKPVDASDAAIGSIHDLYFDEQTWTVRYIVIDTGKWLPGRKVPVIPDAIETPWHHEDVLPLNLTQEQIQAIPEIDTTVPLSRLAEDLWRRHDSWTPNTADLTSVPVLPPSPSPLIEASTASRLEVEQEAENMTDRPLRSAKEVHGFRVEATDGKVGHVEDLLIDDDFRRILFLAIRVDGLVFGKEVLVSPHLVSRVDWASSTVYVGTPRQAIKSGQEYKPAA